MLLLWLSPSSIIPGVLAGELLISSGVLLSHGRVTPGSLAKSCHSWSSCRVVSPQDYVPANFLFPAAYCFGQSCQYWISCTDMSLEEQLPCRDTPGSLAQSCHFWSSSLLVSLLQLLSANIRDPATYCFRPVVSLLEILPRHITSRAQSCHSWSFCPVLSLLELLPSHITPGAFAE